MSDERTGNGYGQDHRRPRPRPRGAVPVDYIEDQKRPLRSHSYLSAVKIIRRNQANVLEGRAVEYNEMKGQVEVGRCMITDHDVNRVLELIEDRFNATGHPDCDGGLNVGRENLAAAITQVAHENSYHPVRQYLDGLEWDGTPRLDSVVRDILRAEDSPLNRHMVRKFFVSACARALDPGCKVDTVLILVGPQGKLKSTFFRVLAEPWFDDTPIDLSKKDAYESIRHNWIFEWAELESLLRARDTSAVKAFLSSTKDTYRPSYGRYVIEVKRHSVIVGSINQDEFLSDETGNRRFWPVRVGGDINVQLARELRDQLWAEAVARYRGGETWWLDREETIALAEVHREHEVRDAWEVTVLGWADGTAGPFTTSDVLREAIDKPEGQWTRSDEMRVAAILKRGGWTRKSNRAGGHVFKRWFKD